VALGGRDAGQNVGALARAFGGGGYFILMFQVGKCEEGRLEYVSRWRWGGQRDVKGEASREEEALVGFQREAYVLWEGRTSRVVRCGCGGDVDLVSFEG
jgi:hypothetical protein